MPTTFNNNNHIIHYTTETTHIAEQLQTINITLLIIHYDTNQHITHISTNHTIQ